MSLKDIWVSWKNSRNGDIREAEKFAKAEDDVHILPNIYGAEKANEYGRNFITAHRTLKYRFVIPLVWLVKLVIGKRLTYTIPKGRYYDSMRILDMSINQTVVDASDILYPAIYGEKTKGYFVKSKQTSIIYTMKAMLFKILLYDTFYKEMMDMLMYNITINMNKGMRDKKIIYNSKNITSVEYFAINGAFAEGKIDIKSAGKRK